MDEPEVSASGETRKRARRNSRTAGILARSGLEGRGPKAARVRRILEIGRACAAELPAASLSLDHDEWLYDDLGLPK